MFIPRILSKASFSIAGIGVQICAQEWTAPSGYDALVNSEWSSLLVRAKQPIWDGTYYRVLDSAQFEKGAAAGDIQLGTIRYRYIATFPVLHKHHFKHHLHPLNHLSTVALIRTQDNHYLFGRRARDGSVDLIGGGVQRDEISVSCGADIERNLYKEINEEVGIGRENITELSGIGVLFSTTSNVLIVGHAHIDLSKTAAALQFQERTEHEMAEPVFVPAGHLREFLQGKDDYRRLVPQLF